MLNQHTLDRSSRSAFFGSERIDEQRTVKPEKIEREYAECPSFSDLAVCDGISTRRWTHDRTSYRRTYVEPSPENILVCLPLVTVRIRMSLGQQPGFDGTLPVGTLFMAPQAQPLFMEVWGAADFIIISIPLRFFADPSEVIMEKLSTAGPHGAFVRDKLVEHLCRICADQAHAVQGPYAQSIVRTIAYRISDKIAEISRPRHGLPKWRLRRVQEFVEKNCEQKITLAQMASVAGLSRMHFAGQFRAATGHRPHEFLLVKRVERAKRTMAATAMPLVEVAAETGFQGQTHFSTVFKRHTGESPGQWRKRQQSSELGS